MRLINESMDDCLPLMFSPVRSTDPPGASVGGAPGGCQKEDESKEAHDDSGGGDEGDEEQQETADSLATAAIISEDPHTVLVEFSSVVADTQEYIIGVR